MINKNSWKYSYGNNQELQPVGPLKNDVLQVLSSWENQTVLQCLKHHRKKYFRIWESKMETFYKATAKETCFFLYLEKGKLFTQLFWLLSFTLVPKEHICCRISVTTKKSDVVKHELQLTSYELLLTSWKLKSTS